MSELKKKTIFKNLWFWIVVILTLAIIIESILFIASYNTLKKDTTETNNSTNSNNELINLSKKINTALGTSNVYYSADGSFMFIEIRNWKNEYNDTKLKELFEILKSGYCKENIDTVTITTYFDSTNTGSTMVTRHVYNLKTNQKIGENETYIDFDTHKNYVESMNTLLH